MQQLHRRNRNGQVLVLVALSLLVLLGVVALAVDGGHLYAERRKMQNAADAGALAGARVLCYEDGQVPPYPEVVDEATLYATVHNGAEGAVVTVSGNLTVTVVATETATTFFARVIGFPTADVAARASAMCQGPRAAGGIWPLSVKQAVYSDTIGCGQLFYAYISKDEDDGISAEDCDFTQVTIDGQTDLEDWIPDCFIEFAEDSTYPVTTTVQHIDSSDRGWLDLFLPEPPYENPCKNANCGEAMVECWIEFGHPPVNIGDCLAGESGNMVAISDDVDARACEVWNLVLFDRVCQEGVDPAGHWYACDLKNAKGEDFYRVDGFGCMRVVGYFNADFPCSKPNPINAQVVIVQKMCDEMDGYEGGCVSIDGTTTGEAPDIDDVVIIALTE